MSACRCLLVILVVAAAASATPFYTLKATPSSIAPGDTTELEFTITPGPGLTLGSGTLFLNTGTFTIFLLTVNSPTGQTFTREFTYPDAGTFEVTVSGNVNELVPQGYCDTFFCYQGPDEGPVAVPSVVSASTTVTVAESTGAVPEPNFGYLAGGLLLAAVAQRRRARV